MIFACVVRAQKVDGFEPSRIIDGLLSTMELHGRESRRWPDVIEDSIVAGDTDDGQVEIAFRLTEGHPPTRHVSGAAISATSIVGRVAELLIGIAPPLTHVGVTVE